MEINENSDNCLQGAGALHQKRLLAFMNHFVTKNVQFLNNFSWKCEDRLIEFESKLNKLEASLMILESQLNSIPINVTQPEILHEGKTTNDNISKETEIVVETDTNILENKDPIIDPRYERFLKMVNVGVPVEAVKLKVIQEGLDPSFLNRL